jgi:transposase-like protein
MSIKRKIYSADFKVKLVLEVLEDLKTINEVANQYGVLPVSSKTGKSNL